MECLTARARDHPRSRGVYCTRPSSSDARGGSSPLARGLLCHNASYRSGIGIIPARAGFTVPGPSQWVKVADHPRSRGVYFLSVWVGVWGSGSSPLARGLLPASSQQKSPVRIIPARAGFTWRGRELHAHATDHPRSRGVYFSLFSALDSWGGSSPLARGLLVGFWAYG